ncbi:MAG: hypothetical protein H0X39_00590 [Actinobacteria bacterium]|nr:hypothetical protein [Actinomycetota bacterium]
MRALAIGIAIGVLVYVVSGGHFLFLPFLFIPFGLFSMGHRRQKRSDGLPAPRRSRWL